jgi:23S rRNA (cytosine1962-C5)-methyltransferase
MGLVRKKMAKVADLLTPRNAISCDAMSQPIRRTSGRPQNSPSRNGGNGLQQGCRWIEPKLLERFAAEQTNSHRLASSREVWIERFGEDLLINYQREDALTPARQALAEWCAVTELRVSRVFGRFIPRQNDDRSAPVLLEGDPGLPLTTTVLESGLVYGLDFAAGYSVGLFLDQRANRSLVAEFKPKKLLNTFAYTCSFSLVAASVGAQTASIDLSKKSLDRGRENFALNQLGTEGHRFIADDVLDVFPRLVKRGERFDTIILDPPTFSRGNKGRKFQVERDMEALLMAALEVAEPKARILISTNCTRLETRDLEQVARYALKINRLVGDIHHEPDLPDIPAELAARTVWLMLR